MSVNYKRINVSDLDKIFQTIVKEIDSNSLLTGDCDSETLVSGLFAGKYY